MKSIPGSITDAELIRKLGQPDGDGNAVMYLYHNYYGPCLHYVLHNNGSQDDAKDIFQEVVVAFLHLVRQNRFRGDSSIKTFLYALNKNLWLNELKRRGRAVKREERYEQMADHSTHNPDTLVEQREAHHKLMEIIDQLGQKCKQILLLYYYENQSMKEIVHRTEYDNEQVVRNKKYKCLKNLEHMIQESPSLFAELKNLLHV